MIICIVYIKGVIEYSKTQAKDLFGPQTKCCKVHVMAMCVSNIKKVGSYTSCARITWVL